MSKPYWTYKDERIARAMAKPYWEGLPPEEAPPEGPEPPKEPKPEGCFSVLVEATVGLGLLILFALFMPFCAEHCAYREKIAPHEYDHPPEDMWYEEIEPGH